MLYFVQSVVYKGPLTIKEKTRKQNMVRPKCLNNFLSHIFINFTGSPIIFGIIVTVYFAVLTNINEL